MKRSLTLGGIAGAVAVTGAVLLAQDLRGSAQGKAVIFDASSKATFKDVIPGAAGHFIWGDTLKGPSGGFTRFVPGFDAGMHTHTNDVLLVVLKGAYLYRDEAGEKRVGAGDFVRIPGGHKHWSGGDAKKGALFYQETFGKFDLVPAK
jgi:mannose-6-phosphate isomerase-like protein (cupin superfamily)